MPLKIITPSTAKAAKSYNQWMSTSVSGSTEECGFVPS